MQPNQKNKAPIKKDGTSILQVVGTYTPYWPLFIIFFLISMMGAYFYLRYTIPKYEANATIIIKDERKGDNDSKLMESLDLINTKKIIENEIEVLQSRILTDTVVKKLHLYAPISQEGKIKSISAYQESPYIIVAQNPDSIIAAKRINLNFNIKKNTVLLDKKFSVMVGQWFQTPYGVLKFLPNPNYTPPATEKSYFFSLIPVSDAAAVILAGLKVSPSSKLSSVIELSYRDEIAIRAEDILNELIVAYSDAALNDKNTLAKNTLAFIEDRLSFVKSDLDSIERKAQQYKSRNGVVDISRQGQLYLDNASSNDKRINDVTMQLAVMDQLEKSANSPENMGMLTSTLGVNDPSLTQQIGNLSALKMQYDKLKLTVAENNPMLLSINEQINNLKPQILSNIRNQRQSLEKSRNSLYSAGGQVSSNLSAIPQKDRDLVEISRDQNIKNSIYNFLLQKREESELSYASTLSDSRVVNYAQASTSPVSPNRMMVYLVAFAFAFACPIAFVTARETLSPKILYRQEIEALSNVPIIGEIAFNTTNDSLVVEAGKRTVIAEEFRKIRVSLLSLGIDKFHKKLVVTSSISGEGKSFIAANLATSISLTGKKVVLVDMDLHNPGLGKFFGIKEQQGISEYLIGKKNIDQIVYGIPGNDNLFYISSGTLQQNSSELLENGKVQTLITQLDKDFDMVIIDAAPIVLITDAYLLSSLCDATLYIVRHQFTPKILVKRMDDAMEINPIKNPGIIFNGVKTRGFFKNNYGYGYNYVYSYENKKIKKPAIKRFFSSN